jgi:hypothetical protein
LIVASRHGRHGSRVPLQHPNVDGFARDVSHILGAQQVLDGRGIIATAGQSCFHRLLKLLMPMLLRQLEQFDNLPGPALLSLALHYSFPDPVEARRP